MSDTATSEAPPAMPERAAAETPQAVPEPVPVELPPTAPSVTEEAPPKLAPAVARRLPRKGEITYEIYYGTQRFSVGRTLQTWEIHDDRYRLSSVSETSGLAAVFSRRRIAYESRGKLTARGLQPEYFTTEQLRSGKREDAGANFDWTAMTASVGNPQQTVALPAQAQDIVSFMYQLGLISLAPGRIELSITNGWKLERYELEIGNEENLETPMGNLRALPVRQVRRPGEESVDLWLATEYRLLPVRILFYGRDGKPSGEQLVSDIRVSPD